MHSYLTIKDEYRHTIEINRSVFTCSIKGIKDFDDALEYKNSVAKEFSDATHNCYAVRTLDDRQKFFDDGEPGGTAGQPILQVIKNNDLYNVVAVVTRYFGGIKLGAGGLVSAYSASVAETIKNATVIKMIKSNLGETAIDYNTLSELNNLFRQYGYKVVDTQYSDIVKISFICPFDEKEKADSSVAAVTAGKSAIEWKETDYYLY